MHGVYRSMLENQLHRQLRSGQSPFKTASVSLLWRKLPDFSRAKASAALPEKQVMACSSGSHTIFRHRYHIVWVPKYPFKVLYGEVRLRAREIINQVCAEMGVTIIHGLLSRDHVHMFVEIPPHIAVSQFVQRAKGRSSRKIQSEFEHIRKRFWARGYFCTTSGNITDDVIMRYLNQHTKPIEKASANQTEPTGIRRPLRG
jgi:putative transposase